MPESERRRLLASEVETIYEYKNAQPLALESFSMILDIAETVSDKAWVNSLIDIMVHGILDQLKRIQ